ncbi:hypothetical protein HWV62_29517 [Athelia sp. TMB]|nr:hypothetical protein HWV62_29517 [Athelia sp. TMB]
MAGVCIAAAAVAVIGRVAIVWALKDKVPHLSSVSCTLSLGSTAIQDKNVNVVTEEGLQHSDSILEAREYQSSAFAIKLLRTLRDLRVPSWQETEIDPSSVKVFKTSGSFTNAVFFVSCPSTPLLPTLLLRIYGTSSSCLVSHPRELHILHTLSSRYHIGPRVYGTFGNGRVEEYFDSTTLTALDLRDSDISRWIGACMSELHCVDIEAVQGALPLTGGEGKGWEIGAEQNARTWINPAREVLALPAVPDTTRAELDIDGFFALWEKYMRWLEVFETQAGASKRVFAHNDLQYGNLLRLTRVQAGMPEHHQIIIVDLEYASPNPAAFDIANHFHEWTVDYHSAHPHLIDPARYPSLRERRNFYQGYMSRSSMLPQALSEEVLGRELEKMDCQVRAWSPASHAMWALWGIVQARDILKRGGGESEFDYIGYSKCRLEGFRREVKALGVPTSAV